MSKDKYLYELVSNQKYLIGQTNVTNDNLTPQSEHLLCTLHRIKPATGLTPQSFTDCTVSLELNLSGHSLVGTSILLPIYCCTKHHIEHNICCIS